MVAFTTPRDWTTGEFVTEAMMDTHIRDNLAFLKQQTGRTTADITVTSSTAFVDATGFSFVLGASEVMHVWASVYMQVSAAGDAKTRWNNLPGGATGRHWYNSGTTAGASNAAIGADLVVGVGGTADYPIIFEAIVVNSTTAGTVQWQFAQFASDATSCILRANSIMIAQRF